MSAYEQAAGRDSRFWRRWLQKLTRISSQRTIQAGLQKSLIHFQFLLVSDAYALVRFCVLIVSRAGIFCAPTALLANFDDTASLAHPLLLTA